MRGMSLAGDISPICFFLEVGGRGVRSGLPAECYRIAHGPPRGATDAAEAFPKLRLGRMHATGFWQLMLNEDTFQSMSRELLELEPAPAAGGSASSTTGVVVRNLSEKRPIRICSSTEDSVIDAASPLESHEGRRLQHGDIIVLLASRSCSLWLTFQDMSAWGHAPASIPAAPTPAPEKALRGPRL